MQKLRGNIAKISMIVMAVAFAAWLVLDWVQSRNASAASGANPVVGVVDGEEIRYAEWSRFLDVRLSGARQGGRALDDEEMRQVRESAWEQLVTDMLIRHELERLEIGVTDEEVRKAFRLSPPPELMSHPAFQTDGRFDYQKYQRYFSGPAVDEALLLRLEQYYRDVLPREKLLRRLVEGVYVSDAELWQAFRDRNETARVRFISVDPAALVPDSAVDIGPDQVRDYYDAHLEDFRRPATATVQIASIALTPTERDTTAARARADSIRTLLAEGTLTFAELAEGSAPAGDSDAEGAAADSTPRDAAADSIAADTAAAEDATMRVSRGDLLPAVAEAVFATAPGALTQPVPAGDGFHVLQVVSRSGDSATVRQTVVPIELSRETEDVIFGRLDRLEGVALLQGLEAAGDSTGVEVRTVTLTEGFDFVSGAGLLGSAVEWALDPDIPEGELSEFFENASGYHLLQLGDVVPAGTFPLREVRAEIERILTERAKRERARERLRQAAGRIEAGASLADAAAEVGAEVRTSESFTRLGFVPGLGRATPAVGAAFGLAEGEVSGPLDAGDRLAIVQPIERTPADREAFDAAREALRGQLMTQRRIERQQRWLQALRERATVLDLRDRLQDEPAVS